MRGRNDAGVDMLQYYPLSSEKMLAFLTETVFHKGPSIAAYIFQSRHQLANIGRIGADALRNHGAGHPLAFSQNQKCQNVQGIAQTC